MAEPIDYQAIIRAAPDLYLVISPDLEILDASDAYLKATMVNREDVIGRYVFDVFPDNPNDLDALTTQEQFLRSAQIIIKDKISHTMPVQKYDIRRPDAQGGTFEVRYWNPSTVPVFDTAKQNVRYLLHRVEDVTELNELHNLASSCSKRFQLLMENIKDYAMVMLNADAHITTWNAGAEHALGYLADEVMDKSIAIIYDEEGINVLGDELTQAREKGRFESQGWRVRKDGGKFWAGTVITPIYIKSMYHRENYLIGYGLVLRDLTLQKEVDKVKSEFVSIVNHELRTPLTSIFGAIRLLSNWDKQAAEKNDHLLAIANSNCERLLQLINDILDIEKLAVQRMSLDLQLLDLSPIVAQAISLNQLFGERYGIDILFSPLQPDVKVRVDASRFIQVLTNLISNAVKFSHANCPIRVDLVRQNNSVRISVTNQGKGIPEQFKNKIFEKFSQADVSTTRKERGTGLGLAISKEIIERFGSSLQYSSMPDKETTFYFDLPVA